MNIKSKHNVIYKETATEELKADIFYPNDDEKHPGIVLIHGGAWFLGPKEMYSDWAPFFASNDYVTISIDYRLSKEDTPSYPEVIYDVQDAIDFFVQNAELWNLDPNNIVLIGDSAGAHLATYIAIENSINTSYIISATIGVYGVYDLPAWQQFTIEARDNDPVGELMGVNSSIKMLQNASPYHKYNDLENAFHTKFFLIWGDTDDIVPASQSESFALLLNQKGFDVQTLILQGYGHFWFTIFEDLGGTLKDNPNPLVASKILNFLNR